jgi:hypothetical protein
LRLRELEEHVLERRLGAASAQLDQTSLGALLAVVEDENAIAQPFGDLEQVRRHQDAVPARRALAQQILERRAPCGSSPVNGSSSIVSGGSCISAAESDTFWRMPCE